MMLFVACTNTNEVGRLCKCGHADRWHVPFAVELPGGLGNLFEFECQVDGCTCVYDPPPSQLKAV